MFRFLYTTDLHGWTKGYQAVFQAALDHEIATIINGGDMFPKDSAEIQEQQMFVEEFLNAYVKCLNAYGIDYYGMFGNDDMQSVQGCWQELVAHYDNAYDLTDAWRSIGPDLIIRGCSYVPDHPFGLKDWSVLDTRDFVRPPQLGQPELSKQGEFVRIADIDSFFNNRPTLADILRQFAEEAPLPLERAVLVSHAPPAATGLANIDEEIDVGSVALRQWIETCQPLLTLHGHIHASPEITGRHTIKIGKTTVHQPGQGRNELVTFSIITIDKGRVTVKRLKVEV